VTRPHITRHPPAPPPPPPDERDPTTDELLLAAIPPGKHIRAHMFEFAFAAAALISAVLFFADPGFVHRTTIGRNVPAVDELWYALYAIGGILVLIGVYYDSRPILYGRGVTGRRIEVAGLILCGTAAAVDALAQLHYVGVSRSFLVAAAFAAGCFNRAHLLWVRYPRLHVPVPAGRS
jgi:hypothetical protein